MHYTAPGHGSDFRCTKGNRLWRPWRLVVLLGVACGQNSAIADGPRAYIRYDNIAVSNTTTPYLKVHNPTGSAVTFAFSRGNAVDTTYDMVGRDLTYTLNIPQVPGAYAPLTSVPAAGSSAPSYSVAAGATLYIAMPMVLTMPLSSYTGDGTTSRAAWEATFPKSSAMSCVFKCYDGGVARTISFAYTGCPIDLVPSGNIYMMGVGSSFIYNNGVDRLLWGTVTLGYVPPAGTITVTGAHLGLNGAGKVTIQVNDGVNVSWVTKAEQQVLGGPSSAGDPMTNTVWTTTSPGLFAGKKYQILLNGGMVKTGTITLSAGSFSITEDITFAMEEFAEDQILDPEGNPLPEIDLSGLFPTAGTDEESNAYVWGELPGRDRPTPPTVNSLGDDPQTDTAANTTVQDEYRAVRGAVEDALQTPGPDFNFADWERGVRGAESSVGDDFGTFAGGTLGAMTTLGAGTSGVGGLATLPGGTPSITLHNGGGSWIGSIGVPASGSSVRTVALIFLSIFYLLAVVAIVRSGFSGS